MSLSRYPIMDDLNSPVPAPAAGGRPPRTNARIRRWGLRLLWTLTALSGLAGVAPAQEVSQLKFHSEVLGVDRNIRIALPESYEKAPDRRYPLILVLDGEYVFYSALGASAVLSTYGVIPEVIVVAIDQNYPDASGRGARWTECSYDDKTAELKEPSRKFTTFITNELLPKIEKDYRTLPFRTIVGHSLTASYIHFFLRDEKPLFQAYIAISPYLPEGLHPFILDRFSRASDEVFYFASTGENDLGGHRKMLMQINAEGYAKITNPHFRYRYEDYPDVTHMSVVNRSMETALGHVFGYFSPLKREETLKPDFQEDPIAYIESKVFDAERIYGVSRRLAATDVDGVRRALIKLQLWDKLQKLGEYALERLPSRPIGDMALARALKETGKPAEAIAAYEKALVKVPANSPDRKSIEKEIAELRAGIQPNDG